MFYFERKVDHDPIGVIILEGCTIELADDYREMFSFKISFHDHSGDDKKGSKILGTDSYETMEEWMKLLACSSHDYMKLMVYELQQQLTELEAANVPSTVTSDVINGLSRNRNICSNISGLEDVSSNDFHHSDSYPKLLQHKTNKNNNEELIDVESIPTLMRPGHVVLANITSGSQKNTFNDTPSFELSAYEQILTLNTDWSHFQEKPMNVNDGLQIQESSSTSNTWLSLHNLYGKKILRDKEAWLLNKPNSKSQQEDLICL